ncbi:MAG: phosphate ABC transporter permease PstA [Spirochaetota bacterium]|nr:phosphate ABC transporter permease PstA [Spirochaetota bacterium]
MISPKKVHQQALLFKLFIYFLSSCALIPLFLIIFFIVAQGFTYISPLFFITDSPAPMADTEFFELSRSTISSAIGGIRNSFIGMIIIVGLASIIAIPFGILVAIYISENKNSLLSKLTLICVDSLQGIPSIIFGIIANIWIVMTFKAYSAISGSFALMIMMLPIIIKSSYETLLLIPVALKESALALGVPYSRVLLKIILPAAAGGISSGVVLGISRVLGETAPLLFTAFGNPYFSTNIFGPMETIAMQIYKNSTSPNANLIANAWGASLALAIIVLILNLIIKPFIDKIKIKF